MSELNNLSDTVNYSFESGVGLIVLNRPNEYNAINGELLTTLLTIIDAASSDERVRALVLTGNGKAFSAGVDLKEASTTGGGLFGEGSMGPESPLLVAFQNCKKPVIGAINGFAVTGGLELALFCDFLYAADTARFADTHALVGLIPGWGLTQRFSRLVGIQRARELSFTGVYFSSQQAMEWGMVNKVFTEDQLLDETLKAAELITDTVPVALEKIKNMMNTGWEQDLGSAMSMEGAEANAFNSSADLSGMRERLKVLRKRAQSTI